MNLAPVNTRLPSTHGHAVDQIVIKQDEQPVNAHVYQRHRHPEGFRIIGFIAVAFPEGLIILKAALVHHIGRRQAEKEHHQEKDAHKKLIAVAQLRIFRLGHTRRFVQDAEDQKGQEPCGGTGVVEVVALMEVGSVGAEGGHHKPHHDSQDHPRLRGPARKSPWSPRPDSGTSARWQREPGLWRTLPGSRRSRR